jgi:glutamate dehydrogenase/leucine dehydrogenase
VIKNHDSENGIDSWLVVDTFMFGSGGGVRMHPNITIEEIKRLARNMTYKHAILGIPIGGAKAGVCSDPESKNKKNMIEKFAKSISSLVNKGFYIPGEDMGTDNNDINLIFQSSGLKTRVNSQRQTAFSTGYGVCIAAQEAMKASGLIFSGSKVIIEGFGKVGSSVAKFMQIMGAKVVGISTNHGAVYKSTGLRVGKLLKMRNEISDRVTRVYKEGEKLEKEDIFYLPADILVPCAGPYVINEKNAKEICVKVICPGSNIPTTEKAEDILFKRGVVSIPDFISNSGGVLSAALNFFRMYFTVLIFGIISLIIKS